MERRGEECGAGGAEVGILVRDEGRGVVGRDIVATIRCGVGCLDAIGDGAAEAC